MKPKDPVSNENVVGPVYKIRCEECETTYVGETERFLKSRFNKRRRPSSTTSHVAKHTHLEQPEHSVELKNTESLTTESSWFERGVKEAIYIRALNPSLNRDGRRCNLPPAWENIIKKSEGRQAEEGVALLPSSRTTPPTISAGQQTDEADRNQ